MATNSATVQVSLQLTTLVDFQSALVTTEILKHHQKNCLRQMHLVAQCNSQVQLSDTIIATEQRNDMEADRHRQNSANDSKRAAQCTTHAMCTLQGSHQPTLLQWVDISFGRDKLRDVRPSGIPAKVVRISEQCHRVIPIIETAS